jgi:hypothetical protein
MVQRYIASSNKYEVNRKQTDSLISEDRDQHHKSLQQEHQGVFLDVQRRLHKAYDQNVKQYNKGRAKLSFEVGDFVWKKNYALSDATKFFAAKFAPRFIKCVVVEKKSDLVYILESMDRRQVGALQSRI